MSRARIVAPSGEGERTMSAGKRRVFRIVIVLAWLVWALLVVGSALAQDGTTSGTAQPNSVDETVARLMPLLVGAALIERTIEFLFNWVERAVLDTSHTMYSLAARLTGLVQIDLREAWNQTNKLTAALVRREAAGTAPESGNVNSADPADWPLAKLQAQVEQAQKTLAQADKMIGTALKSPEYVARKKMMASVLSIFLGVMLALATSLRLFKPIGIVAPSDFDDVFSRLDLVLAGVLMGLGTDWVHQVISLVISGKGLLGRAAGGGDTTSALLGDESIKAVVDQSVQSELEKQLRNLRAQAETVATNLIPPSQPAPPAQPPEAGPSSDDSPA
jgi:hypothetical protein